jgi:hypothetical protein
VEEAPRVEVKISRRDSNQLLRKALRVIGSLGDWEKDSEETERRCGMKAKIIENM